MTPLSLIATAHIEQLEEEWSMLKTDNSWLQDEVKRLRAQVEQLTADAIVRANRQAILVEAMRYIQAFSTSNRDRQIATQALTAIGQAEPQHRHGVVHAGAAGGMSC